MDLGLKVYTGYGKENITKGISYGIACFEWEGGIEEPYRGHSLLVNIQCSK